MKPIGQRGVLLRFGHLVERIDRPAEIGGLPGGVAAHHCVGYPAGVSRVLHDLTPHLMSQPGFVHGELDQAAAELECLLHSRRGRALGRPAIDGEKAPDQVGPLDRQPKGNGGPAGLGDNESTLDVQLVEGAGHPVALRAERIVRLLGMRGRAVAERLHDYGTIALGYQWYSDFSIAKCTTKDAGNQNDWLAGSDGRSAEGLAIGNFYVPHHRTVYREREESQAEQEHGSLEKGDWDAEGVRVGCLPRSRQRARAPNAQLVSSAQDSYIRARSPLAQFPEGHSLFTTRACCPSITPDFPIPLAPSHTATAPNRYSVAILRFGALSGQARSPSGAS